MAVSPRSSRGLEVIDQRSVGASLGVVELIDDHNIERVSRHMGYPVRRQRLHAREHVLPTLGTSAANVQLPEVSIAQHFAVGPKRLLQNLSAMGNEE